MCFVSSNGTNLRSHKETNELDQKEAVHGENKGMGLGQKYSKFKGRLDAEEGR